MARPIDAGAVEAAYGDLAGRRAAGRPYVVVNMVASADGAISVEGRAVGCVAVSHMEHRHDTGLRRLTLAAGPRRHLGHGRLRAGEQRQQRWWSVAGQQRASFGVRSDLSSPVTAAKP